VAALFRGIELMIGRARRTDASAVRRTIFNEAAGCCDPPATCAMVMEQERLRK